MSPLAGAVRLEGWERRLLELVEEWKTVPYELGVNDCFRLTCCVVHALTGIDRWPEFAGRYRTKRESAHLLAQYGSTFEAAFDWFFGVENMSRKLARRGDICALTDENGEKHLVVCMGAEVVVMGEHGLARVPARMCHCAWRVG